MFGILVDMDLFVKVSIPSLAGQTARLAVMIGIEIANQYVSIPSLAGQTARPKKISFLDLGNNLGFNPLISGADRATQGS